MGRSLCERRWSDARRIGSEPIGLPTVEKSKAKLRSWLGCAEAAERDFDAKDLYSVQVRNLFVQEVMNLAVDTPNTPELWDRLPLSCQNLLPLRLLTEKPHGVISLGMLGYKFVQACEFLQR
jgi:hypothetical protein